MVAICSAEFIATNIETKKLSHIIYATRKLNSNLKLVESPFAWEFNILTQISDVHWSDFKSMDGFANG